MRLKPDKAALSDRAWELIAEAVESGGFTLDNGSRIGLNSHELVRIFQWLASLDATKRRKAVDLPEDLREILPGGGP
jgi:hypothetical protein